MDNIKTIVHQGKSILYADFTNVSMYTKKELHELIDSAKTQIAKYPANSILILTNVTGMHFDQEIINMFMDYTAHNKPYIKASAVIGIAGLLKVGLSGVMHNSLRDIHSFDTETEALNWLVEQ